jgi:hypothetical protein
MFGRYKLDVIYPRRHIVPVVVIGSLVRFLVELSAEAICLNYQTSSRLIHMLRLTDS